MKSTREKSVRAHVIEFLAQRWTPDETTRQRGRKALLVEFQKPHNLAVGKYAKLAGVSRQQIYQDLSATPPKLLALSLGKAGKRLPDWQLEQRSLELTRSVINAWPDLDSWTIYHALSTPSGALNGRAPVDAVKREGQAVEAVAMLVLEELGIHVQSA